MKPFRSKYGLFNLDLYTKSHCFCDEKFYNCLKNADNEKAKAVGDFFFNVIGPPGTFLFLITSFFLCGEVDVAPVIFHKYRFLNLVCVRSLTYFLC